MSHLQIDLSRLGLDDPEASPEITDRWKGVAAIYQNYIQPDSNLSLDEAIEQLANYHLKSDTETWAVDYLAIEVGNEIPYDNPAHKKLATLLIAFCKSDTWYSKSEHLPHRTTANAKSYLLSHVDFELQECMKNPVERLSMGLKPTAYVNAQAFSANFMPEDPAFKLEFPKCLDIARKAMMDAFELDYVDQLQELCDAWIMGAAQCILHRAEFMYSCVARESEPEYQSFVKQFHFWQSKKKAAEIEKRWAFSEGQWSGWKSQFRQASRDDLYSTKCRKMAEEVVDLMTLQEKRAAELLAGRSEKTG